MRDELPARMVEGFHKRPDAHLADRLIDSLEAGLEAGGETNPVRSAALRCAKDYREFAEIDLRVDDHDAPVQEFRRLWRVYEPQLDNFMLRVTDPDSAV